MLIKMMYSSNFRKFLTFSVSLTDQQRGDQNGGNRPIRPVIHIVLERKRKN